jgi:Homeodomain-like domain
VSVIDELKGLEDRVARRMQELRPLVDEYRELEQVAERLGVAAATDTPAPRRRRGRRPAAGAPGSTRRPNAAARNGTAGTVATKRSGSRGRAGRRDQLLEMVKARPGITVREAGAELGVDPTSLYRIVHRLEQDGTLQKRGRELLPR